MKILMVITEGDLGGAQRHVLDISRELSRRGHEVVIAVGGQFDELSRAAAEGFLPIETIRLTHTIRSIRPHEDIRGFIEIFKLVRKLRPDIVHCHSSKAGVLASIAGRLAGSKVVYTAHGFVFCEELPIVTKIFYILVEKFSSLFRHRIITVSQSDADAACAHHVVSAKKIAVIPNGIDLDMESRILPEHEARLLLGSWCGTIFADEKIILSIANFYPAKNLALLIRAFESVVPRMPDARLILIGEGSERSACEAIVAANPKLHGVVYFTGKQVDAFRAMRGADVLALSSTKEGMPYVVLEAKLAGIPVVATRVGGVPEMGEGADLRLVVPHSAEMLSDAIVETLRVEKKLRENLTAQFTLRGMVDAVEAVYRSVI